MSKVDAMRALKAARLDEQRKALGARPAVARSVPSVAAKAAPLAVVADGACGHRNMSGRACTRASGHAEKSHRYG